MKKTKVVQKPFWINRQTACGNSNAKQLSPINNDPAKTSPLLTFSRDNSPEKRFFFSRCRQGLRRRSRSEKNPQFFQKLPGENRDCPEGLL
jgi:hypothetical protein